jgi:SOS-response transcriptional repressor LexA
MTAREELDQIKQSWALKTDEELAIKLQTTKFNIDSWVKRNKIPEKWILKIGQMSNAQIPETVSPSNVITIPIFEAVAGCGATGMLEQLRLSSDNFVFDSRVFPSNLITNNIAMIRIVGDSMAPYLDENDWAIIELRNGRDIVPVEAVYLIAYDDAVQIKRVQIIGKKAVIKSDNKEYEPFTLGINDFDIVGKIVGRLKFGSLMLIKE